MKLFENIRLLFFGAISRYFNPRPKPSHEKWPRLAWHLYKIVGHFVLISIILWSSIDAGSIADYLYRVKYKIQIKIKYPKINPPHCESSTTQRYQSKTKT